MSDDKTITLKLSQVLRDVQDKRDLTMRDGSPMTVGALIMEILGGSINMPNQQNVDMLEAWDMIKRLRGRPAIALTMGELTKLEEMIKKINGLIYSSPEMQGQLLAILRDEKAKLAAKSG